MYNFIDIKNHEKLLFNSNIFLKHINKPLSTKTYRTKIVANFFMYITFTLNYAQKLLKIGIINWNTL